VSKYKKKKRFEYQINFSSYDLILTSETIYNIGNYRKLVQLFDHILKPQGTM
jgi:hypothetical protein